MFADYVKMAAKVAVIAIVTGIIVAIFANIQIPQLDLTIFSQAVGKGKAFVSYWVPVFLPFLNFFIFLVSFEIALFTGYIVLIAYRWIIKVNE